MGFINDKLDTVTSINQFELLSNLPTSRITSSIASVNSKSKNLLPFLLDMLNQVIKDKTSTVPSFSQVVGGGLPTIDGVTTFNNAVTLAQSGLADKKGGKIKLILIEILIKFLPSLIRIIKEGIIKAIKTSFSCNSSTRITSLPSVTVNVDTIDLNGMLKVDPKSTSGLLIYGDNPTTDMNLFISNLLQKPNGTTETWGDNILDLTFNEPNGVAPETLTITMGSKYKGKLFDTFLTDFINSISVIGTGSGDVGDTVSFIMNQVMENLFGTISSNTDISVDTLTSLEETNMMMEKVFESDPCVENFTISDGFFDFSNEELKTINDKAKTRYQGYSTIDTGSGDKIWGYSPNVVTRSSISVENLTQVSNSIKEATPTEVNNVISQSIGTISDIVTSNVSPNNKENAKIGFTTDFIKEIPKIFTGVIFTPKMLVFYQMVTFLFKRESFGGNVGYKATDFALDNKVFFNYVGKESLAALYEILFDILKREILKLVSKLAISLVKEKAELKLKSILSITYGITDGLLSSIPTPKL